MNVQQVIIVLQIQWISLNVIEDHINQVEFKAHAYLARQVLFVMALILLECKIVHKVIIAPQDQHFPLHALLENISMSIRKQHYLIAKLVHQDFIVQTEVRHMQ